MNPIVKTGLFIFIAWATLIAILITCAGCSDPCAPKCPDFNKTVLDSIPTPDGGDMKYKLVTEFAIYGMSARGDTITRQPTSECWHDEVYGEEWVELFKGK